MKTSYSSMRRIAPLLKVTGFLMLLGGSSIAAGLFIDVSANPVFLAAVEKAISKQNVSTTPRSSAPNKSLNPATPVTRPLSVFLSVPFVLQAPFGDWGEPWQDACEEASVLMAAAWLKNKTFAPAEAKQKILEMVDYEIYNFGYHRDTSLGQTAKLLKLFGEIENLKLVYDIDLGDIKQELASGNIVIVPAAGAVLTIENPYFSSPPIYHMVVAIGYDDIAGEIIVNDPGTKYGQSFRYSYQVFSRAIHDWTGSEKSVLLGQSGMIVVSSITEL